MHDGTFPEGLRALSKLMSGGLGFQYRVWQLEGLSQSQLSIFAVHPPKTNGRQDVFIYGDAIERDILKRIAHYNLPEMEEVPLTRQDLEVVEYRAKENGIPLAFIVLGVEVDGLATKAKLFHPYELPLPLGFRCIQDAARHRLAAA